MLEMSSVKLQQKMQCYLIRLIKWTIISSLELTGKIDAKCISLYFLFRSLTNGNCLYSSASIYPFGHNNDLNELRWLTSIELYENAKSYCQHSVLLECFKVHSSVYSNFLAAYPRKVLIYLFLLMLLNLTRTRQFTI